MSSCQGRWKFPVPEHVAQGQQHPSWWAGRCLSRSCGTIVTTAVQESLYQGRSPRAFGEPFTSAKSRLAHTEHSLMFLLHPGMSRRPLAILAVAAPPLVLTDKPLSSCATGCLSATTDAGDSILTQIHSYTETTLLLKTTHFCHNQVDLKSCQTNTQQKALGERQDLGLSAEL